MLSQNKLWESFGLPKSYETLIKFIYKLCIEKSERL